MNRATAMLFLIAFCPGCVLNAKQSPAIEVELMKSVWHDYLGKNVSVHGYFFTGHHGSFLASKDEWEYVIHLEQDRAVDGTAPLDELDRRAFEKKLRSLGQEAVITGELHLCKNGLSACMHVQKAELTRNPSSQ